jgi:anthranilate synthase/aminodeoxychorismate synthase-like glutamine amidotransferase
MILLIDNYDSFTHNLARYLRRLEVDVLVLRNDVAELEQAASSAEALVISPGPCGPLQAGKSIQQVQQWSGKKPILGICLGHQVICHAFGATIVRASRPIHGQAFSMQFGQSKLFSGIPSGTRFARYHSLAVSEPTLPDCLEVIATCLTPRKDDLSATVSEVMAVQHRHHPTFGVQFHPESILSEAGYGVLSNFLLICGRKLTSQLPNSDLIDEKAANWHHQDTVTGHLESSEHTAVLPQY